MRKKYPYFTGTEDIRACTVERGMLIRLIYTLVSPFLRGRGPKPQPSAVELFTAFLAHRLFPLFSFLYHSKIFMHDLKGRLSRRR